MTTFSNLAADLIRPRAYPVPRPASIELRTTHLAWVFLTEADVYKVKRPVSFAHESRASVEARLRACEAEVGRNERLAAGVYLGVAPVRRGEDGRACLHGTGEAIDWAVHMLRLPDAARADVRLARGRLRADDIDRIAAHLAGFHSRCATDARISAHGAVEAIAGNVLATVADAHLATFDARRSDEERATEAWQLDFVQRHVERFDARRRDGFVRDVHGDLRLEHVYLEDAPERGSGVTILDCIELADDLRWSDVACDLALLSMDLAAKGRVDLAERLLGRYARASGDYDLYEVIDFYESYRASMRARMSKIFARAAREDPLRAVAEADARRYSSLALACGRRPAVPPMVVAVGGAVASARSQLADALGDRLAAPVVLAAIDSEGDRAAGEMLHCAGRVLGSGRPVVLDGTFGTPALCASARKLARRHGVGFLLVDCRAREGDAPIATELGADERVVVDLTFPRDALLATVASRVSAWPRGLVA